MRAVRLARRVNEVPGPPTLEMMAKTRALIAQGADIVNLTVGEPDFDTPEEIREAAKRALDAGITRYSPVPGLPDLRAAIAEKLKRDNGLDYSAEEIVVTNGAKQAISDTCLAFLEEDDEAIIPSPYWAAYPGTVEFTGAKVVYADTTLRSGFKLTPETLEAAITPRSRLLFLNSPCNPTGAVYRRKELDALVEVVRAHPRLWILSDEIYERIDFTGQHVSTAAIDGAREHTVTINGMSKAFAMTGWRIGYVAAPEPVARLVARAQATLTAGANPFAQTAAAFALRHAEAASRRMSEAYRRRRDLVVELLGEIPDLRISRPDGAFYAFFDCSAYFVKGRNGREIANSNELANYLLDEAGVSTVAGAGFGDDRCIRISTAASEEMLREGVARVARALAALR
jgi:aspartate aminotransferase